MFITKIIPHNVFLHENESISGRVVFLKIVNLTREAVHVPLLVHGVDAGPHNDLLTGRTQVLCRACLHSRNLTRITQRCLLLKRYPRSFIKPPSASEVC